MTETSTFDVSNRDIIEDIDTAWEAVKGTVRPQIHTFIATSDIHTEHKLRLSQDDVLEAVGYIAEYTASKCKDMGF